MKPLAVFLLIALLLSACSAAAPTEQPAPPTAEAAATPLSSPIPPTTVATPTLPVEATPTTETPPAEVLASETPAAVAAPLTFTQTIGAGGLQPSFLEGYWIQNTSADGLCSDSPRLLGFDPSRQTSVFGGAGGQVCTLDIVPFLQAFGCYDGCFGFPRWWSSTIDQISTVNAVSYYHGEDLGCFPRPAVAGEGGRCTFNKKWEWECRDPAKDAPFASVWDYAIDGSDVEWFLAPEALASSGLRPKDRRYNIPQLIEDYAGVSGATATYLAVSAKPGQSVWVGTTAGLLKMVPGDAGAAWLGSETSLLAGEIVSLQAVSDDCVLAAADGGVALWDGSTWQTFTPQNGLPGSQVRAAGFDKPDKCDAFWAVTENGPAHYTLAAAVWQTFPGLPEEVQWRRTQYGEFTTAGQGAWKFIAGKVVSGEYHRFDPQVGAIAALAQSGRAVVAAGSGGAAEWDGAAWQPVASAASAAAGDLVGSADGLRVFDGAAWQLVTGEPVLAVTQGGWFATAEKVCRWADGQAVCPPTNAGPALAGATALGFDPESGLLAVIDDQERAWSYDPAAAVFVPGLELCFTPKTTALLPRPWGWALGSPRGLYTARLAEEDAPFEALFPQLGLSREWAAQVRAVAFQPQSGLLWLATNQGVFYTAEAGLAEAYDRGWTHLSGLPERSFTAILPLPDGSAWLGAESGAVYLWRPAP